MPVKVGLKFIEKWGESIEDAIVEYEAEPIIKDQIVFYGASNFTRWGEKWGHKPMREVLLGGSGAQCVINRGFGSSCPEHQLYYYSRIIRPLEPRILVYSPGYGNARAFGYTLDESFELAARLMIYAMTDFPNMRICICGSLPKPVMTEARIKDNAYFDGLLREFASNYENCRFLEPVDFLPAENREAFFVEDKIHFNQAGYELYADYFRAALKDELALY